MSATTPLSEADRDALKREAAEAAIGLVRDGMVVGLGTGSTATFAVEALAKRYRQGLRFLGLPTSEHTARLASSTGIPLTSFAAHQQIDLTIDGADEVELGTLNLIKGLGGALLREKIVAAASRRLAIIVDDSKLVDRLGTHVPVPVEVVEFGLQPTWAALETLGATAKPRVTQTGEPFVTDGGNRILDCDCGQMGLKPNQLRCRPAIRRPVNTRFDPATGGTTKSGKSHCDLTEKRRDHVLPVVFHAARAATA
jgi:ribose 5-phosphate isomerase A